MASTGVSRIENLDPFVSFKAPVKTITTANLTLSGAQTVNGVSLVEDDRLLVNNQTDATENGIYTVKDASWVRADDMNGTRDVTEGTMVYVQQGTTYADTYFRLTTTGTIVFGTSSISFTLFGGFSSGDTVNHLTIANARADSSLSALIGTSAVVRIKYYSGTNLINADYDVVAAGTGTHDGFEYHSDDGSAGGSVFQLKLRFDQFTTTAHAGADTTGVSDCTAALEAQVAYCVANNLDILLPAGRVLFNGEVTCDIGDNRSSLRGAGMSQTRIIYNGAHASTAWFTLTRNGGTATPTNFVFSEFSLSGNSTATYAGIEVVDGSFITFENLFFSDFDVAAGSTAVRTKGREGYRFKNIRMSSVYIGFYIDQNPNHATIHFDVSQFENIFIVGEDADDAHGWYVAPAVSNLFSFEICGSNVVAICKYGFYWVPSAAVSESTNVRIKGLRVEGGDSTNKDCWLIHIDNAGDVVRNLHIEDCRGGVSHNGTYLRGIDNLTMSSCQFAGGSGYTWRDWDTTVNRAVLTNVFFQTGSTDSTGSLEIAGIRGQAADVKLVEYLCDNKVEVYDGDGFYQIASDVYWKPSAQDTIAQRHFRNDALSDDAQFTLPDATAMWGEVFAINSSDSSLHWGKFLVAADGTVTLVDSSGSVVATNTDTNLCIYDTGTQAAIRNRLGAAADVTAFIRYGV